MIDKTSKTMSGFCISLALSTWSRGVNKLSKETTWAPWHGLSCLLYCYIMWNHFSLTWARTIYCHQSGRGSVTLYTNNSFNKLLLWNYCVKFLKTWQEALSHDPLPKYNKTWRFNNNNKMANFRICFKNHCLWNLTGKHLYITLYSLIQQSLTIDL